MNVKKLPYEASYSVLKNWLDGCNKLRSLDFNVNTKIKDGLRSAGRGYLPIGLQKLMIDNRKLYDLVLHKPAKLDFLR